MKEAGNQEQKQKKTTEIQTFSIPFSVEGIKETINVETNNSSKEKIVNQVFKFHSEGNIEEAVKYYKYLINKEQKNFRVFYNYGLILMSIHKPKEAEANIRKSIEINPHFPYSHYNLGNLLKSLGKLQEAELSHKKAIQLKPDFAEAHTNLGNILKKLGKLQEAELSTRKAIQLKPNLAIAHYNLGTILSKLGKSQEAEISTRKAIELKPDLAIAHSNLGNILSKLGQLKEAELSTRKAIELKPDHAIAHYNLGDILSNLGKSQEAELFTRKAIKLDPDFANAHSNLGIILSNLGKFEEAEFSQRKAIELNPNLAICYQQLSLLLYHKGNINLAVQNIEKAFAIDRISKDNQLLISVLRDRRRQEYETLSNTVDIGINQEESCKPVILKRLVEPELIESLYKIKAIDLNKYNDPSFGNAKGSDYKLFENNEKITKKLETDLTDITKKLVSSDVFFRDSFFTILSNGIINKHNHIGPIDKLPGLNLWKQKYALVYYLSVGNQNCKNPGALQFYKNRYDNNPHEEILPSAGMIVIFPAHKYHSVRYDGNKNRIIIGVNFYRI